MTESLFFQVPAHGQMTHPNTADRTRAKLVPVPEHVDCINAAILTKPRMSRPTLPSAPSNDAQREGGGRTTFPSIARKVGLANTGSRQSSGFSFASRIASSGGERFQSSDEEDVSLVSH